MNRLKELKYFTLAMLLCCFVGVGALTSCRDKKKEESTETQAEHPEDTEHSEKAGEEHPEGQEHPEKEGQEHPKDSVSG